VYTLEEKTLKKLLQMSVEAAAVDTQMLALRAAAATASGANGEWLGSKEKKRKRSPLARMWHMAGKIPPRHLLPPSPFLSITLW
jgi:hypothetical protein